MPVTLPLPVYDAVEPHLLFVYGTLCRRINHPMARLLAMNAQFAGTGRLNGRLYHLGRYPGAIFSHHPDEWVRGELYELKDVQWLLDRLDRYEGLNTGRKRLSAYQRVIAMILLDDGTRRQAWVYHYRLPVSRLKRLISGDYLRQRRHS